MLGRALGALLDVLEVRALESVLPQVLLDVLVEKSHCAFCFGEGGEREREARGGGRRGFEV